MRVYYLLSNREGYIFGFWLKSRRGNGTHRG